MFQIKRGDRRPYIEVILEERVAEAGQTVIRAIDLTGLTVKFLMKNKSTGVLKVDATASIIDAEAGQVRYAWASGDTDTVGVYTAEWEIDYGLGIKQTVPGSDYQYVSVNQDLG